MPFLELIQLLQHGDGNSNVVVIEREYALGIVKDHIGIENEQFLNRFLRGIHSDSVRMEKWYFW